MVKPHSKPSYICQFTGELTELSYNDMDQYTSSETIQERINRKIAIKGSDIALYSSWNQIHQCMQRSDNTIITNCGIKKWRVVDELDKLPNFIKKIIKTK
jgi:hypothetical protein